MYILCVRNAIHISSRYSARYQLDSNARISRSHRGSGRFEFISSRNSTRRMVRQMATGCAVSPAFTFHNRKTRATSPSPSPLSSCRAKLVGRVLNIIDAVARTHARTHGRTRECVYNQPQQPRAATWTLRARRFIISREHREQAWPGSGTHVLVHA